MKQDTLKSIEPRLLGERLKTARKARGLTQEFVAEQLGILRTTLIAIEKGERRVTSSELIRMAELYACPISELVSQRQHRQPFAPQFRVAAPFENVQEADLMSAALELESLAREFVELEELAGAVMRPSYPLPYQFDLAGVTPEQRGEEVAAEERTRLGLGDGPIADLRSLLEEAVGIKVFYINLPARVGGLFAYNDDLGACIGINRNHPPTRGNWSLAHEYAHFLTTRYLPDVTFTSADHWGKMNAERFADSFAKNLLMPRTGVSRRLSEMVRAHGKGVTVTDVLVLAGLFKVSVEAMFRRLEELKRIPLGTWAKLELSPEKARSALGLTAEPKQPALPLRYRILAKMAFDDAKLTEGQLARKLRVDRVSARLEIEKLSQLADKESEEGFTAVDFESPDEVLAS